jgi:hypothetical protein
LAVIGGKVLADVLRLMAQALVIAMLGVLIGAKLTASANGIIVTAVALFLFAIAFCRFPASWRSRPALRRAWRRLFTS